MKISTIKKLLPNRAVFLYYCFVTIVIFATVLVSSSRSAWAVDITLTWDENSEEDHAGYRIFYRESGDSYDYSNPAWEGTDVSCTIYGLDDNTTYYFVARAFDEADNESGDSDEVIYQANQPPVLNTIGAKSVDENSLLTFAVAASDPDGDDLTYSVQSLPAGASFNETSRTFAWTPGYGTAGNYTVTFTVTDNGSPNKSDSEDVTITVGDVNRPPVLNAIGAKSVDENTFLTFTVAASDPDGDDLTYSAESLPAGASFNATSRTFVWTPGYGTAGNYTVTFTVTDNGSPAENDSENITIAVEADEQPPGPPSGLQILY